VAVTDPGDEQRRRRRRRRWLAAWVAGLLLPNAFAAAHAWALTHYVQGGERPRPPQELTAGERLQRLLLGVRVPRPENGARFGGPFDAHHIDVEPNSGVTLEAWRILVLDQAPRAQVLIVPGYGASKSSLLEVARRWHARGVVPILLDPRGVGGSSGSSTTLGAREGEDVAIAADYFRTRHPGQELLLHGVSQGAAACLRAVARRGAQVDGLVLESCYGRLTDTVRARVRQMGAPASPGAELLVLWGSVLGGFNGFGLDPVEDAASAMGVPSLVLHGDADPTVPVEAARELADALGARLVLFPGAGHVSLVGAAPDAWEAATTALLDEVAPR
jgi:alpha-beta hydrolase superfamily lysophospholipase